MTPLMLAAQAGYREFVRILLWCGADPLVVCERNGYIALHWACLRCHGECVRLLLEMGPLERQLNARDGSGLTPLCVACRHKTIAFVNSYCSDLSAVDCTVKCGDV